MGNNPSGFTEDDNLPVENISWDDTQFTSNECCIQLPSMHKLTPYIIEKNVVPKKNDQPFIHAPFGDLLTEVRKTSSTLISCFP